MTGKNLDAIMAAIHPESPDYAATRQLMDELMENFARRCTLEDAKVISCGQDEAQVLFVQTTEKISGDLPFGDNWVAGIHTLRKHDRTW